MTAVISGVPSANLDLLTGSPKCLFAQAAVPGRTQGDGWGVAFFNAGGRPAVVKSSGPAGGEKKAFARAAAAAVARVSVAHLRDASNPGGINKKLLISRANTQPFTGGGLIFSHNGTLFIKEEIKSLLGKYAAEVKGLNDSEILFWQIVKMLDVYGSPVKALEMALDEIRTVWISCKDRYPDRAEPYRGLNIFLASKNSLTVLCHYPGARAKAAKTGVPGGKTALLSPGWEFGRIAWRREGGRTVFSSEPADDRPGWKKMSDLQLAHAELKDGKVDLKFSDIKGATL
ncbi:MAG TPA: class II glutamine amidotransferase [Elusimicrobiales bacterium]|nr:class II glutamine amidotransferase [Elusimicrobiales bacterium]